MKEYRESAGKHELDPAKRISGPRFLPKLEGEGSFRHAGPINRLRVDFGCTGLPIFKNENVLPGEIKVVEKKPEPVKEEIPEEIDKGDMPPFRYLIIHTKAKLSQADIQVIKAWAQERPDQESGEID